MRGCLIAMAAVLLALGVARPSRAEDTGFGHYRPAAMFTEHVSSTQYLPMRDGVRLAVRITRPRADGQAAAGALSGDLAAHVDGYGTATAP